MASEKVTRDPLAVVYPVCDEETDAIVIRCADPRFRRAFDDFVADLGIRSPATIAVTGRSGTP